MNAKMVPKLCQEACNSRPDANQKAENGDRDWEIEVRSHEMEADRLKNGYRRPENATTGLWRSQLRPHVTEDRGNLGPNRLIDPHRAFRHTSALWMECCDFRSLHFTYLLDGCLYDDLPKANLEPGVSGRNSLPLPGTPGPWAPAGP